MTMGTQAQRFVKLKLPNEKEPDLELPASVVSAAFIMELKTRKHGNGLVRIEVDPKSRKLSGIAVSSDLIERGLPTSVLSDSQGPAPRALDFLKECESAGSELGYIACAIRVSLTKLEEALN